MLRLLKGTLILVTVNHHRPRKDDLPHLIDAQTNQEPAHTGVKAKKMKMLSAGHDNYRRWHDIFDCRSAPTGRTDHGNYSLLQCHGFDPTAQLVPPRDPTAGNASSSSIG